MSNYNELCQCGIAIILWITICRIIELFYENTLTAAIVVIGSPIFIIFTLFILNKRVDSILLAEKTTVKQIKILYYMIGKWKRHKLELFLISHYRNCKNISECLCHKIIKYIGDEKNIEK